MYNKTIFVIDDSATNLVVAKQALETHYNVRTMSSATRMFKLAERIMPDLILLDVEMPEIDGYETLILIKKHPKLKSVPVIFLTAMADSEAEVRGFELGAVDYIIKPFSTPVLLKHLEMHLNLDSLVKKSVAQIKKLHNVIISSIADIVESRDRVTGGHIVRTQKYLKILLDAMMSQGCYREELMSWDMDIAIQSAQLHDLGKISIPDMILNKPDKLNEEEFNIIKNHTIEGERIITDMITKLGDDDFLIHAKLFAGNHHEKWDGTGYPRGLSNIDIPLQGRIMAIADVYDALVSRRPYKRPLGSEEAINIILEGSGFHFDPEIIKVFKTVANDFWIASMEESAHEKD